MKTTILLSGISLLLLFSKAEAQTNVYHPMLSDTTAEWISYADVSPPPQILHKYWICGSKVIKGNKYYKICKLWCQDQGANNPCILLNYDTIAFLREDTVSKKIYGYTYFYKVNPIDCNGIDHLDTTQNEYLLYDFDNLYVGKPLYGLYNKRYDTTIPDTVGCMDSMQLLDGTYRTYYKYPTIDYNPPPNWPPPCGYNSYSIPPYYGKAFTIVGIGNITLPFNYWFLDNYPCVDDPYLFVPRDYLICYKKQNIPLWTSNAINRCNLIVSVNKNELNNAPIKIFPNMIEDNYFYIEGIEGESIIGIYDVKGSLIFKGQYSGKKIKIDLMDIQKGLYFVNVKNERYSYWNKIIKN